MSCCKQLGRILVLPIYSGASSKTPTPTANTFQSSPSPTQPVLLLALNATDKVAWGLMHTKVSIPTFSCEIVIYFLHEIGSYNGEVSYGSSVDNGGPPFTWIESAYETATYAWVGRCCAFLATLGVTVPSGLACYRIYFFASCTFVLTLIGLLNTSICAALICAEFLGLPSMMRGALHFVHGWSPAHRCMLSAIYAMFSLNVYSFFHKHLTYGILMLKK